MEVDFEKSLKRLDEITNKISAGDISLDESLALYAEAKEIIAKLQEALEQAKDKVEKVVEID